MVSDPRIPAPRERRASKARFRCRVCARFVRATEYGVCPRCGVGPPEMVDTAAPRDERAWQQVSASRPGPGYWVGVALFAIAIGAGGALLAVC